MSRSTVLRLPLAAMIILLLALSGIAVAQDGGTGGDPADDPSDDSSESDDPSDDSSEDDDDVEGMDSQSDTPSAVTGGRVFGPDRISTAVAISRYEFPHGSREVYLAQAENFADAVAGGSLRNGPVLLVPDCGDLPEVVADELARLRPRKVVALGGSAAICDEILSQAVAAAQAGRNHGHGDDNDDDELDDDDSDEARTEETTVIDLADGGTAVIAAGEAGSMEVGRTGDALSLISTTPVDDTWTVEIDEEEAGEVDVSFRNDDARIDVKVEIEDGQVEVRIRTRRR